MKVLGILLLFFPLVTLGQEKKITVTLHSIKGYDGHEDFAQKAIAKLEAVLNSTEFEQKVLKGKFKRTNKLSNQALYNTIMQAKEVQGPGGKDQVVDLRVRTITLELDGQKWMNNCELDSNAGTIGIDGKGDGITAICPQRLELWHQRDSIGDLAGHYMHEYMHIIGFSHSWYKKRKSAVYKVGYIVRDLLRRDTPLHPITP